jgi:hypothetical protein
MLEKLTIAGIIILLVAYFVFIFLEATEYQERQEKEKQEAIELRIKNAKLEEKLKALDDKKAE